MKRRGQEGRKRKPAGRTAAARPSRWPAKPRKKVHKPSANSSRIDRQNRTRELNDALEQLAATSEVLRVISTSPGDLKPVFASILENAVRICGAEFGNLLLRDGDTLRTGATRGSPRLMRKLHAERGAVSASIRGWASGKCSRPNRPIKLPTCG